MSDADRQIRGINRLMAPISRAMRSMVLRGVISLVNDAAALQRVQVQMRAMPQPGGSVGSELGDNLEVMGHYGFTSVPLSGAEAAILSVMGVKAHGLVVATDDRRYRPTGLKPGEVMLYDHLGNSVKLGTDEITITAVTKAHVVAPIALIESADVQLGAQGGKPVARVGDQVDLSTGLIKTGSGKVTAA